VEGQLRCAFTCKGLARNFERGLHPHRRGSVHIYQSQTQRCFNATALDDDIFEYKEELYVNLTSSNPAVSLSPQFSVLKIKNSDSS